MNILRIGLSTAISFTMGAMLFHTPPAQNPQESGSVHVYIYPVFMDDAKTPFPKNLPGGRIAGISCIPKPEKLTPNSAVCYVATTLN